MHSPGDRRSIAARAVPPVLLSVGLLATALLGGCTGDDSALPPEPTTRESVADDASVDPNAQAIDTLVQTGLAQLDDGDVEGARGSFTSVLALDPDNVLGHYNLGVIAQQEGRSREALTSYAAALATDPDHVPSLFNSAILLERRDLDEAVKRYRRVVELDATRAPAWMRLGFALVHLGQAEEGEDALAEGIRLDPAMASIQAPRYD